MTFPEFAYIMRRSLCGMMDPPEQSAIHCFVWCLACEFPMPTADGTTCGQCGREVADKAPAIFYAGAS